MYYSSCYIIERGKDGVLYCSSFGQKGQAGGTFCDGMPAGLQTSCSHVLFIFVSLFFVIFLDMV